MSGIATSQGMSNKMVAGIEPSLDYNGYPLINQLSLTSTPVKLGKSPLTNQMASYYVAFGKKRRCTKQRCNKQQRCCNLIDKDINYIKHFKEKKVN